MNIIKRVVRKSARKTVLNERNTRAGPMRTVMKSC